MLDTEKVKLYNQLWVAHMRYEADKAIEYAQKGLDLSEEIGFKKGIADAYVELGILSDEKKRLS